MLCLYSCNYPTGVYTGREWNKERFLCVLTPDKVRKIRDAIWLCVVPDIDCSTSHFPDKMYVSKAGDKITITYSEKDSKEDAIVLSKNNIYDKCKRHFEIS